MKIRASVDIVFCHQLLHHASDPLAVLRELNRVLAPGGWLLVAESCRAFLEWWPVRFLFRHPRRQQSREGADPVALVEPA
ncbi:MAG: methyltransferase domain-containing protein [Gammaproteobacteria bacterium]